MEIKFELKGYLKNKVFVGVTIFLVVAIAVAMFIPNIISAFKSGTTPPKDLPVMLVYAEDETLSETVKEYFTQAFPGYHVKVADGTPDDIKSQITSGSVECAFVLNSPSSYTYYVNNLNMRDSNQAVANTVLQEVYRVNATVAWYEIFISIIILIGSTVGIGVLSAKIYRVGVLLYGTPPRFTKIIKEVLKK